METNYATDRQLALEYSAALPYMIGYYPRDKVAVIRPPEYGDGKHMISIYTYGCGGHCGLCSTSVTELERACANSTPGGIAVFYHDGVSRLEAQVAGIYAHLADALHSVVGIGEDAVYVATSAKVDKVGLLEWKSTRMALHYQLSGIIPVASREELLMPAPTAADSAAELTEAPLSAAELRRAWKSLKSDPEDRVSARLLGAGLADIPYRDAFICATVCDPGADPDFQEKPASVNGKFMLSTALGEWGPAYAQLDMLRTIAGACSPEHYAAVVAVAAYIAWFCGMGGQARVWCDQALAADGEYSLAQLVSTALSAHVDPPWISERRAHDWAA